VNSTKTSANLQPLQRVNWVLPREFKLRIFCSSLSPKLSIGKSFVFGVIEGDGVNQML